MRTITPTLTILLTLVAARAVAADRDAALAVVDAAVRAHGGEEALRRSQSAIRQANGVMSLAAGQEAKFTSNFTHRFPDRLRLVIDLGAGTGRPPLTVVLSGDKGWSASGRLVEELPRQRVEEVRSEAHAQWLATLVPLRTDATLGLVVEPERPVEGRTARVVKVSRKGEGDVRLLFDKESQLLVKMERTAREAGLAVEKEYLFSQHRAFDGVRLPERIVERSNGRPTTAVVVTSYRFVGKLEDALFEKP